LLTGASGFVGRRLAKRLRNEGWQVTGLSRRSEHPDDLAADLADPRTSIDLMETGKRFDVVLHLGASVALDASKGAELFASNVYGTAAIVRLAQLWQSKFVLASTIAVHGSRTPEISLSSCLDPDTAYAQSKLLAEQLVESSGIPSMVLRLSGIFGAAGPAHLGLNRAISGALSGTPPVRVGGGSAKRNYLYVDDAVEAFVWALSGMETGTRLVAGHEVSSVAEMLDEVCSVLLPASNVVVQPGAEANDQVVQTSSDLPPGHSFREALMSIKRECQ
jgi:UDP-glucose 4-epimerase